MSGTDYASELLGGAPAAPSAPAKTDYAQELLGGRTMESSVMRPVEQESVGAKFGTMVKSSMVDDPHTKMRIYAKDRFPKLQEQDALSRYGVIGGEIVYLDDDGRIKKESPSGVSGFIKDIGASLIGQAPAVVGGTVGAVAGAPAGPGGAAAGGALGAAGGKGFSQLIANLLYDEPQSATGNALGMGKEAAVTGGTTYLGSKLAQKIGERSVSRDISKLDRQKAEELITKGRDIGVDLNVPQATNLPSLKGRYEVLGRLEQSMDIIDENKLMQGAQASKAATTFMDVLSGPPVSSRSAGDAARNGATNVIDSMTTNRALASKPWYDKALQAKVNTSDEELQAITGTDAFKRGFERAQRIAKNEGVDLNNEGNTMRLLHYVKLGIGDLLDGSAAVKEGVGSTERRAITGVQNRLVSFMDKTSPDYARARSIYGHYMPTLNAQRSGLLGEIADLPDSSLNEAARRVFNPKNAPEDVRNLRSMFFRYDQGEKWNGMLKSYLQETLEKAGTEFKSGAGGIRGQAPAWRAAMFGNMKQAANLKAAMTEPQFQAFGNMMDVFEAMGRVTGAGGSPTMPLQVAKSQLEGESMGIIPKLLTPVRSAKDWLIEARLGKHAEEMARVMTSPDGMAKIKQLKEMSIMDKRFAAGFASLFGIGDSSSQTPQDTPIRARADGGPVTAGKPYLVGERGPEIVVPQQSGTVVPNDQWRADPRKPDHWRYNERGARTGLKGPGWLGALLTPDNQVMTENSIGVNINGKQTEIPSLVPGLSPQEVTAVIGGQMPESVVRKAADFARQKMNQGQSPFAQPMTKAPIGSLAALMDEIRRQGPAWANTESRMDMEHITRFRGR